MHPEIVRMEALARSTVWWPGIDQDVEIKFRACLPCQETRQAGRPEPARPRLHPWEFVKNPWSRLHIDFARPFQGKVFLLVVDEYSKWLEVIQLASILSDSMLEAVRCLQRTVSQTLWSRTIWNSFCLARICRVHGEETVPACQGDTLPFYTSTIHRTNPVRHRTSDLRNEVATWDLPDSCEGRRTLMATALKRAKDVRIHYRDHHLFPGDILTHVIAMLRQTMSRARTKLQITLSPLRKKGPSSTRLIETFLSDDSAGEPSSNAAATND